MRKNKHNIIKTLISSICHTTFELVEFSLKETETLRLS